MDSGSSEWTVDVDRDAAGWDSEKKEADGDPCQGTSRKKEWLVHRKPILPEPLFIICSWCAYFLLVAFTDTDHCIV